MKTGRCFCRKGGSILLLSQRFRLVYFLRVWQKRIFRYLEWLTSSKNYCRVILFKGRLPFRVYKHQSRLIRKLGGSDIKLQFNKVANLKLAAAKINGIIIRPGETFSFWKTVGPTSKKKGYKEGLCLSDGEVSTGIGGGLCQLSNLIFWMVLHTPLKVTERHRHSFDPFPDSGRIIPFGTGASVFYNYIDLELFNPTIYTFQILIYFDDKHIKGEVRANRRLPYSYHIVEKDHLFIQKEGKFYRKNEIWRKVIDRKTGNKVSEQLAIKNFCEVKYRPGDKVKVVKWDGDLNERTVSAFYR